MPTHDREPPYVRFGRNECAMSLWGVRIAYRGHPPRLLTFWLDCARGFLGCFRILVRMRMAGIRPGREMAQQFEALMTLIYRAGRLSGEAPFSKIIMDKSDGAAVLRKRAWPPQR